MGMVLVSSSEVVGNNPSLPWSEEADRVLGPTSADRWGYASAKAEKALQLKMKPQGA